jgi:hypothetical protein
MADLPLLFFPLRGTAPRKKKTGGGGRVFPKSRTEQETRLSNRLTQLEQEFEQHKAAFQADPDNTSPELVLVLELATSVTRFAKAAAKVGFTVLGEWDGDEVDAGALGFEVYQGNEPKTDQHITSHIYLTSVNLGGIEEFRKLFDIWREESSWPRGTTPWRDLFNCISEIRRWGPEDRIRDSGLQQDWQEAINSGVSTVRFEADFWFRPQSAESRAQMTGKFSQLLSKLGGSLKHQVVIDAIGFHGVLGELPTSSIGDVDNLAQLEFVKFEELFEVHSVTQSVQPWIADGNDVAAPESQTGATDTYPIVAMIDGVPMQNHPDLAGYVRVVDTDGLESQAPAAERVHGSQMASLILNGDLTGLSTRLRRPIVARPVLVPDNNYKGAGEKFPTDKLAIDTFHRAVVDLVGGGQRANLDRIHVVNVSLGDIDRMFLRRMSSWARLIDWLSFTHRVLFVISAGNCSKRLSLAISEENLPGATPEEIQALALDAIYLDRRNRRLLAPAESINALTVGAARGENSAVLPASLLETIVIDGLCTAYSGLGGGYRNILKPDVLAPGGRQLFRKALLNNVSGTVLLEAVDGQGPPGLLAASPSSPVQGPRRSHTRGTSAAAALTTRLAAQAFEYVETLDGFEELSGDHVSVMLKALVAHTATWGDDAERELEALLSRNGVTGIKVKDAISRFLGHGCIRPDRALSCTDERVTVIGYADINDGDGHIYEFPWPAALRAVTEARRLTITLASLVPTTPTRYIYRGADVWVAKPGELASFGLGSGDRDPHSVQRGTLQHTSYVGERASDFADGTTLKIQVNCRADSMRPDEIRSIPYALVVTLEVPESSQIRIYEQVALALRTQARVAVR